MLYVFVKFIEEWSQLILKSSWNTIFNTIFLLLVVSLKYVSKFIQNFYQRKMIMSNTDALEIFKEESCAHKHELFLISSQRENDAVKIKYIRKQSTRNYE